MRGGYEIVESDDDPRLQKAHSLLEKAEAGGGYPAYEKAIAAFSAVIAAGGGGKREARKGKARAQLAYAREALINRDYDLALGILDEIPDRSRETVSLRKRALEKRSAAKLARGRFPRWTYLLLAMLTVGVIVWINLEQMRRDENQETVGGMLVDRFNRGVKANRETSLPIDYYAIFTEVSARRFFLKRYPGFEAAYLYMLDGHETALVARGGGKAAMKIANSYMYDGLPLYTTLYNELLNEQDPKVRRSFAKLILRLRKFIGDLEQWKLEAIEEDPFEELRRENEAGR